MFTVVEIMAGTKYDLGRHAWDIPLGDFEYLAEFTWLAEFSFLVHMNPHLNISTA